MGILTDYENAAAVNDALNKGVEANNSVSELKEDFTQITELFPTVKIASSAYIRKEQADGLFFTFNFPAERDNRVYVGGKNIFDGTIKNVALGTKEVLFASNYRGFIVPIKGGLTYTISRSSKSSGRFRIALTETYPQNQAPILGYLRVADNDLSHVYDTSRYPTARYMVVYLSNTSEDVSGTNYQVEIADRATAFEQYKGTVYTTDNASLGIYSDISTLYAWCDSGNISANYVEKIENIKYKSLANGNTGNLSIVCAKEHRYTDGTQPVTEGYLVEECSTKRFFFTKDFSNYRYMFTTSIPTYQYAFGMLENGDVVACKFADVLSSAIKSDENRVNPYCWLADENWEIEHEVDFGTSLKPCGWLENCGFKVLANGHGMFCEYTRKNVETANVWEIEGSPANAINWHVRKSFDVTSIDEQTGFKHIHLVEQDCYTGVIYISTGDDNENSMIWYSTDNGQNWTLLRTSEKYCRNLSITFTEEYVYWTPDTQNPSSRYLFKAERDNNGIIDVSNVVDYVALNSDATKGIATYGASYIPEYNCMLILDRCDGSATSMELDVVDLTNGTLHKVADMHSVDSTASNIGFRTRYSEFYPKDGKVHFGFGFKVANLMAYVNKNKGFGNQGLSNTGEGVFNVNNLVLNIKKSDGKFVCTFNTIY